MKKITFDSGAEYYRADEVEAEVKRIEARAAELQFELDCITRERDAAIAEMKRANAGFAALKREYDQAMTRLAAHGEKVTA